MLRLILESDDGGRSIFRARNILEINKKVRFRVEYFFLYTLNLSKLIDLVPFI
jgi:hypothetical protein